MKRVCQTCFVIIAGVIWLTGSLNAQGADSPTAIQVLGPQNNDTVEGEFIISAHAFDRRGEESGIERIDVYAGTECSGESLVQRTSVRTAREEFAEAFKLEYPFVRHALLVRADQAGEFTYTICFTSSFSQEIIGEVTQTVNVTDLSYRRKRMRVTQPLVGDVITAPFWVIGQTYDTAGGDELAPGIESVKVFEGNRCNGKVIAEGDAVGDSAAFANDWLLSSAYANNRFDILVPADELAGITGEYTFQVCSFSAFDGALVRSRTITITLTDEPDTEYIWESFAQGFYQPVDVAFAEDGRVFVVQKTGEIYRAEDGQRGEEPVLDISHLVISEAAIPNTDSGLLGMALDPDFMENGYMYVYYVNTSLSGTLARYTVDENNHADLDSREEIFTISFQHDDHVGGQLLFDEDGYLYLGIGDNNLTGWAQDLGYPYGSILRFDISTLPYTIPADNPFVDVEGAMGEIYFYGLRNPWRFSIDEASNQFWIADVGDHDWEELNVVPMDSPGLNFGWPVLEGKSFVPVLAGHRYYSEGMDTLRENPPESTVSPVFEYQHVGDYCAIIGGHVYHGEQLPELEGQYLYADYCAGTVERLLPGDDGDWRSEIILKTPHRIVNIGVDLEGELVYIDIVNGGIYTIIEKDKG